jgi:hypothetical protein
MPLEEIIGELILRPILELVVYGVFYWTGYLFLKGSSFGTIRLAPLSTTVEGHKTKWYQIDWSLWVHRPRQGKALKAECTCLVGLVIWLAVGYGIYLGTRG